MCTIYGKYSFTKGLKISCLQTEGAFLLQNCSWVGFCFWNVIVRDWTCYISDELLLAGMYVLLLIFLCVSFLSCAIALLESSLISKIIVYITLMMCVHFCVTSFKYLLIALCRTYSFLWCNRC